MKTPRSNPLKMLAAGGGVVWLLWVGACGLLEPDPWRVRQAELDVNRTTWENAGITAYTYQLTRECYCALAGEMTVTVADRVVVAVTGADGPFAPSQLAQVETIDDLFDVVQRAIDERAFRYVVEYHPALGHPTVVDLDPIQNALHEEVRYEAGEMVPDGS